MPGKERDERAPILPETVAVLDRLATGLADDARIIRARQGSGGAQAGLSHWGMRQISANTGEPGGPRSSQRP